MNSSNNQHRSKIRDTKKQVKYSDDLRRVEPYKRSASKPKQTWSDHDAD